MGGGTTKEIRVDHLQLRITTGDITTGSHTRYNLTDGLNYIDSVRIPYVVSGAAMESGSPSANNSTDCNGWSNPPNAESSNDKYAVAGPTVGAYSTMYQTFGFNINASKTITKVEVLCEWFAFSSNASDPNADVINVSIGIPGNPDTCGSGNFDLASADFPNRTTEGTTVIDVTSQHDWIPSDFNNANLN